MRGGGRGKDRAGGDAAKQVWSVPWGGGVVWGPHCGWFGDHTMGVYVSKHADYTFWFQKGRNPTVRDEGTVLLLELVTGRVNHFERKIQGAKPTAGYVPYFSIINSGLCFLAAQWSCACQILLPPKLMFIASIGYKSCAHFNSDINSENRRACRCQ